MELLIKHEIDNTIAKKIKVWAEAVQISARGTRLDAVAYAG